MRRALKTWAEYQAIRKQAEQAADDALMQVCRDINETMKKWRTNDETVDLCRRAKRH